MAAEQIHIERLAFGGRGVGRINGKVCFVPYSCPGDELKVRITSDKRSYQTGVIERILVPSAQRTPPSCPAFGVCGGCDWQHVNYEVQLEAKRAILADALWRGARVPDHAVRETVCSPLRFGYRSRVQFKVYGRGDRVRIGFYRDGSHFVEDLPDGCPVALPRINEALQSLRKALAKFPEPDLLPQINIDCADEGAVAIIHYIGENVEATSRFFEDRYEQLGPLTGLFLQTGRKASLRKLAGDERLVYHLPSRQGSERSVALKFLPGGFSQVNSVQNVAIVGLIWELASLSGQEQLLDLYCGNGNLSLPLVADVAGITGIEEYPDSVAAAIQNAADNGIVNAEFICEDAVAGVRRLAGQQRVFDLVLLDPPRSGAAEAVQQLPLLAPKNIIYVSCDPSTLARDCGILKGSGYEVVTSIPVDMFPQTYHLESVTLLQRA